MNKYSLTFRGYFVESDTSKIPHASGVYIVYRCIYNRNQNAVSLKELMYIGQAADLNNRICNHDKKDLFKSRCEAGETLCYSIAELDMADLNVVENALIYAQQPPLNENLKNSFNYSTPISFELDGRCSMLNYHYFNIIDNH